MAIAGELPGATFEDPCETRDGGVLAPPPSEAERTQKYPGAVTSEQATPHDSRACHDLMWTSVVDLSERQHLLATVAAAWWVAEETDSGRLAGFARKLQREGLWERTEFFVVPDSQGKGVGRRLLALVFPAEQGVVRCIVATSDVRAQARYYTTGIIARFPLYTLVGCPGEAEPVGDLAPVPIDGIQTIQDQQAIGFFFVGQDGVGPAAANERTDLRDTRRGSHGD
jgi:GNAT superfamily N-acetyltransferase